MINIQSKNWHLFFAILSAAGVIVSAVSLLEAIHEKNNAQLFILLFTFWLITSWKSYRKKALEKAR